MKNYKVVIEYEGTNYNGLQKQAKGEKTIYTTIHKALLAVFDGSLLELNFCGRTDAGVHAYGQVFNVKTDYSFHFPQHKLALGINYYLRGEDVSAISSTEVPDGFHARYSCTQRIYKYKILNRSFKSPIHKNKAWLVPYKIELNKLIEISNLFVGTYDFTHFRNKDCTAKSPIKTVDFINIEIKDYDIIEITIGAKSFLYNMVRSVVGAMVDCARGKASIDLIEQILQNPAGIKRPALQVAPSSGLYFLEAKY